MVTFLSSLKQGQKAIIQQVEGGQTYVRRISALGFLPQTRIEIIRNHRFAPVIVRLRNSEIMIGRGEAAKIKVRAVEL